MRFALLLPLFAVAVRALAMQPPATDLATLQRSIGKGAVVAELHEGEATFAGPIFARVEVASDGSVLLTVRNDTTKSFNDNLDLRFFNSFGALIYEYNAPFSSEPISAGVIAEKHLVLGHLGGDLSKVLGNSTITLPEDWKAPKFVSMTRVSFKARPPLNLSHLPSFGTGNSGVSGRDARWSNYGDYMNKLEETVQIAWDDILSKQKSYPPHGTSVQITFILTCTGDIKAFVQVTPSAGMTEMGTHACEAALRNPAPFGKWTDDMIAVLGTEQRLTFTFFYG